MERPSETPRLSRAITSIATAISVFALNCSKPDMTKSTTPEKVPFKRKITADCTGQKEVDYEKLVYFSGSRRNVRELIKQCIKGTLKKTGRRSYKCKVEATRLENMQCD